MEWLKMYSRGILYGTTANMSDLEQATWFKLLAIANETKYRDGSLRFGEGQPMPRSFIATLCHRTVEQIEACITIYKRDINIDDKLPRLQEWNDGTLFITNFEKYQAVPDGPGKSHKKEKLTISAEGKEKRDGWLAEQGAIKHPEDAKRGLQIRAFEDAIKAKNKQGGD